jgi:hypothetical protein
MEKFDRELPFAFKDAFGSSINLAALVNGIWVPNFLTAFSARIKTAIDPGSFHSFGCESGFMETLVKKD